MTLVKIIIGVVAGCALLFLICLLVMRLIRDSDLKKQQTRYKEYESKDDYSGDKNDLLVQIVIYKNFYGQGKFYYKIRNRANMAQVKSLIDESFKVIQEHKESEGK